MSPKCPKVTPKASQLEPRAAIFVTVFCKKATLHPTAYLLCFRHILEVLGSPVLKKFLLKMCVGSRSSKKVVTLSAFLIFRRKCVKMGAQMGGGKSPKNCSFSHWSPFGCPWVHCYCILHSLGIILAPFWVPLGSFLLSFAEIQHYQGAQHSMQMNPQSNLATKAP